MTWYISSDINFPYLTTPPQGFVWRSPYPSWLWIVSPIYMDGLPYLAPLAVLPTFTPVKQRDYIRLYPPDTKVFNRNGLRILSPLSGDITEELNGGYELTCKLPLDNDGAWRLVGVYSIIFAWGQAFRVYKCVKSMANSGEMTLDVSARHVFYDLNSNLTSCAIESKNGQEALNAILSGAVEPHNFTGASLIADEKSTSFSDNGVTAALLGNGGFTSIWGGELYRDNFSFSLNARRGQDNAFFVSYGADMTAVSETVDYSDVCTIVICRGGGKRVVVKWRQPSYPVQPIKTLDVNVNENSPNIESILYDAGIEYLKQYGFPLINYSVSIIDIRNNPLYAEFVNLQRLEVGDIGTVYNRKLGIHTKQQIVKKTIDLCSGETKSIELGVLKRTLTGDTRGYGQQMQAIIENEIVSASTWQDALDRGFTWGRPSGWTWGEDKGLPT